MRPFNLAETKIAERNHCRTEVNRRLRVVLVLFVTCVLITAGSFACKLSISAKATRLKSELGDVQQRCVKVKQEMSEVKLRAGQRKWQQELTQGSKRWLIVLNEVLARLPADAWITRVENSPQNSSVSLEGGASSYESVSAYINRLRAAPGAGDVRLSNSRVTVSSTGVIVEFALQLKLKAAVSPPPATQTAGVPTAQGST